jgi:hypothetical protein
LVRAAATAPACSEAGFADMRIVAMRQKQKRPTLR